MNELELRQLFKDRSDCYADTREYCDDTIPPILIDGDVIQAITEDRFIEILKEAKLLPSSNKKM